MKVIFLDIDGVLNFESTDARAPSGALGIVDSKVKLVKEICDATGAKIVLISKWKDKWNIDDDSVSQDGKYMVKKFKRHGLHILTKVSNESQNECINIEKWLSKNNHVEGYTLLSAATDLYKQNEDITMSAVFTDASTGLQQYDRNNAIDTLMYGSLPY